MGRLPITAHHPSPAILLCFFLPSPKNQKYWGKIFQNYPNRFWNVWKIDKITWNMHSSAKNLAKIRQKTTGRKKGQLGALMASDGQTAHHCPSPAILLCFFLPSPKKQKFWWKFVQNYPNRFWNMWKIDKITCKMHSSAKNLAKIRQKTTSCKKRV